MLRSAATACLSALDTSWLWILQYGGAGGVRHCSLRVRRHDLHLNHQPLHLVEQVKALAMEPIARFSQFARRMMVEQVLGWKLNKLRNVYVSFS